jgi:beta-phosphoglucomutase
MLPAAVIFDMDGLLVDTEPLHGECWVRVLTRLGFDLTLEEFRQRVTMDGMSIGELFVSVGGDPEYWEANSIDLVAEKTVHLKPMLESDDVLMPGAVECLSAIRNAKLSIALATSARLISVDVIMDRFALRSFFDVTVSWNDVQASKPSPAAFLLAAERLCAAPAQCVVLEDSPRGVLAAHRAGMKCIAVPNASTIHGDFSLATLVVDSLAQVSLQTLRGLF